MLIGLVLLFVGAVLCLNGLWILGYIADNEIAIIDFFVGAITAAVAIYLAFWAGAQGADLASIRAGALTLLFTFTYLWVALNRFNKADGRGLGWFCLFVAITAGPVAIITLAQSEGKVWPVWFGLCWAAWAVLWFLYWVLLALKRPIARFTGGLTVAEGILTGWLPGFLLLFGYLSLT